MFEKRDQAGIGVLDLVIAGDDNRNPRRFELRETQLSVLAINIADCELAVYQILALRRVHELPMFQRMSHRVQTE